MNRLLHNQFNFATAEIFWVFVCFFVCFSLFFSFFFFLFYLVSFFHGISTPYEIFKVVTIFSKFACIF